MTTWQQITEDKFIIRSKGKVITVDNLRSLIAYSMAFGLEIEDIEYARKQMIRNYHDYAEFGIWGTFIMSKRVANENCH